MEKLLFFDYSALVIDIVILGCMLLRKMTNGKLNKVFIFLAAMAVFTNTIDIIAVSFDKSGGLYIVEKMVYHSIYLLLRAFTSFFCMDRQVFTSFEYSIAQPSCTSSYRNIL